MNLQHNCSHGRRQVCWHRNLNGQRDEWFWVDGQGRGRDRRRGRWQYGHWIRFWREYELQQRLMRSHGNGWLGRLLGGLLGCGASLGEC